MSGIFSIYFFFRIKIICKRSNVDLKRLIFKDLKVSIFRDYLFFAKTPPSLACEMKQIPSRSYGRSFYRCITSLALQNLRFLESYPRAVWQTGKLLGSCLPLGSNAPLRFCLWTSVILQSLCLEMVQVLRL